MGTDRALADVYSPEPNVLERKAAGYLVGASRTGGAAAGEAGEAARRALKHATRRAVWLAVLAGVISGGLIGGSEIWMRQGMDEDAAWQQQLPWWIGWFAFAGVVSAIEIGFLYWLTLRGIVRVTNASGIDVTSKGYPVLVKHGLARGALEFPNPRVEVFGIDPYAYVPSWQLMAKAAAYKMKVGVSSFILRVFLRRVAARVAIRGIVPLMAGPLYAAWNAFIVWRIMVEGRLRALGPTAVERVLEAVGTPDEAAARVMVQGAGEMMKLGRDAHPNTVYLLARLREEAGEEGDLEVDWGSARARLKELPEGDRGKVIAVLALAAILGTRVRRDQADMLRVACEACGLGFDGDALGALHRDLRDGKPVTLEALQGVCGGEIPR
jgi:hypothetical protein